MVKSLNGLNSPYKFVDPTGLAGSDISCGGNTSGGGQGSTLGSCESERSLERYNQRLENTLDAAAANRAVAEGDQETAESICAGNANITCNRARGTNVAVTILPDGPNDNMSIGELGRDLLITWEGYETRPYDKDSNSSRNCTVGIGHLLSTGPCSAAQASRVYSAKEIDAFFREDVAEAENVVKSGISVKLNQNQFDALVVLALNLPKTPKLYAAINSGDTAVARKEWLSSNKVGKTVEKGLTNRRNAEWGLFMRSPLYY